MERNNNVTKTLLIILGLLILISPILFIKYSKKQKDYHVTINESTNDNLIRYPKGNFEFNNVYNWKIVNQGTINPPRGYIEEDLTLLKNDECALAYVNDPYRSTFTLYKDVSFGDQYDVAGEQISSRWYVSSSSLPSNFDFAWHERIPINGEFNESMYASLFSKEGEYDFHSFVLFNPMGGTVAQDCYIESVGILKTLRRYFDSINLTKEQKGEIYFYYDRAAELTRVLFNGDESHVYEVMNFNITSPQPPTIYKNNLYIVEGGVLQEVNLFSKAKKTIILPGVMGEDVLNDFYFYDNYIFYTVGQNCLYYMAHCDLTLYQYDMDSGVGERLASNVTSQEFMGYKPEDNSLYLAYKWGDAGCSSYKVHKFNLITKKLDEVGSYAGCEGDILEDDSRAGFFELEEYFNKEINYRASIILNNGELLLPNDSDYGDIRFIK